MCFVLTLSNGGIDPVITIADSLTIATDLAATGGAAADSNPRQNRVYRIKSTTHAAHAPFAGCPPFYPRFHPRFLPLARFPIIFESRRSVTSTSAAQEHERPRFTFGENWRSFLERLDDKRVTEAEQSLQQMLGNSSLAGKRFLDIGSGSGLFSLAAHNLGADVVSIDYDHDSVGCTQELKRRFAPHASNWQIDQGSVLDQARIESLGTFDIVYSWGVLHHTGEMDRAIEIAANATQPGGQLFLAIYNDQGGASRRWLKIKQTYNRLPKPLRPLWVLAIASWYECKFALARLARLQNPSPLKDWRAKREDRGMSAWHDWVDWVGGLPFEVAKPERIIMPLRQHGFVLNQLKTVGNGWGCNEYVFERLETNK